MPYFGLCWARTLKKKSAPSNLSDFKVMQENNNAQMWNQNCLIWLFFCKSFKKLLSYLKSTPSNLSNIKILQENKIVSISGSKMPSPFNFGLEF